MIIESKIKEKLKIELAQATSIWIASAMISSNGWSFLKNSIPKTATQFSFNRDLLSELYTYLDELKIQ